MDARHPTPNPARLLWLLLLLPALMGIRACEKVDVGDDSCPDDKCDSQSGGDGDGGDGDGDGDTTIRCEYGGDVYAPGDSFGDLDGCNECSCSADGQVLCTERACPPETCGGIAGLTCPTGQYCHFDDAAACGNGDQTGVCEVPPDACTDQWEPVCGCDGQTHGNRCEAAAAGTSVASEGECEDPPPAGCEYGGRQYAVGDSFDALDGCNTCTCAAAGDVACTERACPPQTCGGFAGVACPAGQYCEYPAGSCNWADHSGVCKPNTCDDVVEPVCGCDGQNYDSACRAGVAGITVDHAGLCHSGVEGSACGGIAAVQCQGDLFCDYPIGTDCGAGDQQGRCTRKAEACTDHVEEVCGCDGVTYTNPCEAQTVGVSVRSTGPCP